MASYSGTTVATATAAANTADLVVLSSGGQSVAVVNDSGTAPIWFTVGVPGSPGATPTVNGANCYCAASVAGKETSVRIPGYAGNGIVVQLISPGTPQYTCYVQSSRAPS